MSRSYNATAPIVHTVDCLIVVPDGRVLLIRRGTEPFLDKLVLPGGHVEPGDLTFESACCRELREELGLLVSDQGDLEFFMELENLDPRPGRHISQVYVLRLASWPALRPNPTEVHGIALVRPRELNPADVGFSHYQVIARFMEIESRRNGGIK